MYNSNTAFQSQTSYAGDISPNDAWQDLSKNNNAILIDVRTPAEWAFVGEPNLESINKQACFIAWRLFPSMEINNSFEDELSLHLPEAGKESSIYFICRSGSRSKEAAIAMTKLGYKHCYNVEGGFEGEINSQQHRGKMNGWKAAQLPWKQR